MSNPARVLRGSEILPHPARAQLALAALVIVAAGGLAYSSSFAGVFTFDDLPAIRENPTIRTLWPLTTALSPPANSGVGGRPLANLSFALNHAIGGAEPGSYHVVNLLLHLGSALLLFGIVRRTCRWAGVWPACAAAAIWAVHPLTTGAVTWVSQRTELLMAFLYLLALYAFVRRWLLLSVVACALGMMSKEVMVTAPVLVLLYDRTFVAGTLREAWRQRRAYYVSLAATWGILGYLLTTGLSQRSVGFGLGVSPLAYALAELQALPLYLKLAAWPSPLIFDYGAVYAINPVLVAAGVVLVGAALAWTAAGLRRRSAAAFASACVFLLLAPTSSFVPVAEQPIAENRMYLPLAALVTLAAGFVRGAVWNRSVLPVAAGAAAVGLGLTTFARNRVYHSETTLWTDTALKRPQNPRAHYNLGVALLDAHRPADALACFERAIALNPREPKHHSSAGNALVELKRPAEALPHFAEAVRLAPNHARAWYNYGRALFDTGDAPGAIARFERALQLEPGSAETHNAIGNAFFQLDRPREAIPHYEAAVRLDPRHADAHYNCGSACLEAGRVDEAITHFAAAAKLKPQDAEVRNNLGAALVHAGRSAEAIVHFEEALRLRHDYGDARDNLALARAALQQPDAKPRAR